MIRLSRYFPLLWLFVPLCAQASDADSLFEDVPMVLTATRVDQPVVDAPASVTVIDREWIENSAATDLPELLKLVPGFIIGHADGTKPMMTYHGIGSTNIQRIKILVNGRSLYNPTLGTVDWSKLGLSLDDIDRIEVIRGPNSAAYGANALLAVVNIRLLDPTEIPEATLNVHHVDEFSDSAYARVAHAGKDFDFNVSVSESFSEGFEGVHDDEKTTSLQSQWIVRLDDQNNLNVTAGGIRGYYQTGFASDNGSDIPRTVNNSNAYLNALWESQVDEDRSWQLRYYYDKTYDIDKYSIGNGVTPTDVDGFDVLYVALDYSTITERQEIEWQYDHRINEDNRYLGGLSFSDDAVYAPTYLGTDQFVDTETIRAFGNWQLGLSERWTGNLSATAEHNDITGNTLSPRLALTYALEENHRLRFIYSQATRNPTSVESQADWEQSAILGTSPPGTEVTIPVRSSLSSTKPETIRSHEAGYHGQLNQQLTVDIKLFRDELRDLFELTTDSSGALVYDNVAWLNKQGIETSLEWRGDAWRVMWGETLLHAESSSVDLEDSIPEHISTLSGFYRLTPYWTVSAFYYYYDTMSWVEAGTYVEHYQTTDLRLKRRFSLQGEDAYLAISWLNVDGDDVDYQRENINPDRVMIELGVSF